MDIKSQEEYIMALKDFTWWDNLKGNIAGFFYRYG
jgi:hypothetical protein